MNTRDWSAVVAYESMFGNSEKIAWAIADGIATITRVSVINVTKSKPWPRLARDVQLLVAGGPTHDLSMSRPRTRASASRQATPEMGTPPDPDAPGLREWLSALPQYHSNPPFAAAFDTRASRLPLPRCAGKAAYRTLRDHGFRTLDVPAAFVVDGVAGPLVDGALERAYEWGRSLALPFADAIFDDGPREEW